MFYILLTDFHFIDLTSHLNGPITYRIWFSLLGEIKKLVFRLILDQSICGDTNFSTFSFVNLVLFLKRLNGLLIWI